MDNQLPPLRFLHVESSLIELKLNYLDRFSSEDLLQSLRPGESGALKTREDGTVIDGHHRLYLLRRRGIAIDQLPREIVNYT